jgi:hypothetical protein
MLYAICALAWMVALLGLAGGESGRQRGGDDDRERIHTKRESDNDDQDTNEREQGGGRKVERGNCSTSRLSR